VTDTLADVPSERLPTILDERLAILARTEPLTVSPGTSLADCLRRIQGSGKGDSILVVDAEGHLLGVLPERDIVAELVAPGRDLRQPVEDLMNTEPRTFQPDQTIRDAMELMQTGRYRNVPLVDEDGRVAGIVRQRDLLRYLAESFPEAVLNLPPRPDQQIEEPEGA
jgi:CBS domain-containing protein